MNIINFLKRFGALAVHPVQWPHAVRRIRQAAKSGRLTGALADFSRAPAICTTSYQDWIANCESAISAGQICATLKSFKNPVSFSIFVPVWNPDPEILKAAIDSVVNQSYPHWQLCLVDNYSDRAGVQEVLTAAAEAHPSISLILLKANSGIAQATNRALKAATGDFVAFLDHDDLLATDALFVMAQAIEAHPEAQLLYSDEDKIDQNQRRFSPYFKPDFDAHLLLAQNYLCHFLVVSRSLANRVGGLRKAFDGAQDHDFILRCTEILTQDKIVHVSRILYHWRAHAQSTALNIGAKTYALSAGDRAVLAALDRNGVSNVKFSRLPNLYRQLQFSAPDPAPGVTIIVPTKNRKDLLEPCLVSLFEKTEYSNFDVIVVDNASDDPEAIAYLETLPERYTGRIQIMAYSQPFNYSDMNNLAAKIARGKYLCFMNNDIEIIAGDWLTQLVGALHQKNVGVVGGRLLYPDGSIQHNGILVGFAGTAINLGALQVENDPGYFGQLQLVREVSAVTGACMLTPKKEFLEIGGFDAQNFPVAFNDVDYCLRLREQGKKVLICPPARLKHHESATLGDPNAANRSLQFQEDRSRFIARWQKWIEHDPAYNPNLDLRVKPFALTDAPRGNTSGL